MKKLLPLLAFALVGCATTSTSDISTPIAQPTIQCENVILDDKARALAETLYNVPAHAYVTADTHDTLPASLKAKVKPMLIDAYGWLLKARVAHEAQDRTGFGCAVANLRVFNSNIMSLLRN